ncbi:putative galactinol--sucrose galactosyltransferase 6 [Dichotomopilus funicola]|uniref:Galactinol--sucrose galactosyltransferase 6 n=1 Tax=Dichotomopilus funicola TaxID=1934379 RepID=A0AAN6V431_9PEZI|nr:putative galactinol--sucrose galactosyltransferase 6 [Dichotomopilus funicola]
MVFIATYPPLGQVTQLSCRDVTFQAVLEVPTEDPQEWQLALWYSPGNNSEWMEVELVPVNSDTHPIKLHDPVDKTTRQVFSAQLSIPVSAAFTVKFRQQTKGEKWRWVRNEQGVDDGVVIIDQKPTDESDPEDLPDLIHRFNPDLKWESQLSQSPGTRLWSIEVAVPKAGDGDSAYVETEIGDPWGQFVRWFALVRTSEPWLAPRKGRSELRLDTGALLCSFLSPRGKHMVFLGINGINDVATLFQSGDIGEPCLLLNIRSDNVHETTATVLVAVGDNIENTIAAVMYHARTLVAVTGTPVSTEVSGDVLDGDVQAQWYEKWYDGLGYCTWNSLGQRLTENKVLDALDTLTKNKINVASLIIDDNWQDIDYHGDGQWQYGWNDFEAEPKNFPRGLKALVSDIRSKHKHIQHIAVWHALLGYWGGIAPDGPLARRYKTIQAICDSTSQPRVPDKINLTLIAPSDVQGFYNDFYAFLTSCSITGVKTDAQYRVDTLSRPSDRRALINPYLDAWMSASLRHFSGNVVACMSQTPPLSFHSYLPNTRPAQVWRNSNDFFPNDSYSHPWHIWTNAHNAVLAQHLNVIPDWDMFQTAPSADEGEDGYADVFPTLHAAARCLSGGPVCITDAPGRHDLGLIRQISGRTTRGKTVVFRPSVVGRALDVYNVYRLGISDLALLKIGAYHGRSGTGTGIVGVFNLEETKLTEILPLKKFPGVVEGQKYVVRSHSSGAVTAPLEVSTSSTGGSLLEVSLGSMECDILSAYPLHEVESKSRGQVLLANLGLVGKMTGGAAVTGTVFEVRENGRMMVEAGSKALGIVGIYISILPDLTVEDDFMVTILGQPVPPHTVSVSKQDGHVLEVDVETAWDEMGLEAGWSNEPQVKVNFALDKK